MHSHTFHPTFAIESSHTFYSVEFQYPLMMDLALQSSHRSLHGIFSMAKFWLVRPPCICWSSKPSLSSTYPEMRVLGLRRCKVGERKVGQVICNFQLADINPQHFAPLRHLMCQRAGGRPGPGFQGFQGGSKVRWGARACGLKQVAAKLHYSRATPIKMLRRYWEINPAKKSIIFSLKFSSLGFSFFLSNI